MTVIAILAGVALLLAIVSVIPETGAPRIWPLAVAVILLAVGLALPVLTR